MADTERPEQQHPNLHLSPEERRLFGQLFAQADTDKIGVVTGEVAVKFFEKTRLSPDVLGEIWQLADTENRGLLTPAGFGIVLRLIGYAQAGRPVSAELALKPGGPLPRFDGITAPPGPPPSAAPLQAQPSGGPIRVPPLTPDKVAQFSSLFEASGAQNGMLSGETAKSIFERANLPNEVLGRIWNLADTEQRGHLGLTEFIIAMHLLASFKNGSMRALPQILPAGLYEAAARRGGPPRPTAASRTSPDGALTAPIPRQFSGAGYAAPPRQQTGPLQSMPTGDQWAVTSEDKAQYDQIFATVDTQNRGYITGEQAVGFFSNSRLPEEALAQIWDLADINSEGQLNLDEFAVAMYLIRQQRNKTSGRGILPPSLPPNLVPPSMRRQPVATQQSTTAPVFGSAASMPKSASEDLFGLDAFSAPAPIQPKATGDSSVYSTSPRNQTSPQLPIQQAPSHQTSHFKPFIPSSSFGQTIMTPQGTGTSGSASPVQPRGTASTYKQASVMDDLLGDNDPEVSKKLTNETSELANLSSQVSTLTGQMQEIKTKRASTEQDVSQAQAQKRDFEGRLGQLRLAYEQEIKEVRALEERLTASRNDTRKLQSDMAMIQGTHEDLQNQHRQIGEALSADQNENANLKDRIRKVSAEINELKPELEKMRSDARHQKGLVAINKKQLATQEAEKEKVKKDVDGASAEYGEATRDLEQSKRDLETASQARSPPAANAVASPTPSTASLNPFFRSTNQAPTERGAATSPFTPTNVASPNHDAFDSFFGPSAPAPTRPPPTSFGNASSEFSPEIPAGQPPSNQSSDEQGEPTPSASPPPSNFSDSPQVTSEPPAPPQSRQITSSFLPLRPRERSGSETSSVKVVPPASRAGDRSLSGFETPTHVQEPSIPESPREHFQDMAAQVSQHEPSPPAGTSVVQEPWTSVQKATISQASPRSSAKSIATQDVPGAFPGDESPIAAQQAFPQESNAGPYSSLGLDPRVDAAPRSVTPVAAQPPRSGINITDPFAKLDTPTSTKDDFDSAFADFADTKGKAPEEPNGTASSATGGPPGAQKSHREFPPIQEFGGEDESESEEERGFDDDFTTRSAKRTKELGPNQALEAKALIGGEAGGLAPIRPPFASGDSDLTQLPTPGAQVSPPTYDQSILGPGGSGTRKESNQFPPEFSGLLPSRETPTSPATSPPRSTSNATTAVGIDRGLNFFGNENPEQVGTHGTASSTFSQDHSPMSPGASATAPYAYTQSFPQSQQPISNPPIPPKDTPSDSFDDEFGDLSEAKEVSEKEDDELTLSRRNDLDDFNPTFDSPHTAHTQAPSTSSTFPSNAADSFAAFEPSTSGTGGAASAKAQQSPAHDWDAIFAGLDNPRTNHNQPELSLSPLKSSAQNGTFPVSGGGKKVQPQQTEDTASDDPILKRLTGMGFERDRSLRALERFDYNIDKAAEFLISKS